MPLILIFFILFPVSTFSSPLISEENAFKDLMAQLSITDNETLPREKIIAKGDLLTCTGNLPASNACNKSVELIENGKIDDAIILLEEALKHAPLFVPFRYNLAVAYSYKLQFLRAHINIDKAIMQFPEYYLFYLTKGSFFEMSDDEDNALVYYKKAYKLNRYSLRSLIIIGDLYFSRNQHSMARQYYDAVLKQDVRHGGALLGIAKIEFSLKKIYLAYMTLKKIDLKKEDYDKSYYYYYAECAYKLKRFKEAHESYVELLKYRNDKFFIKMSLDLIEHKADLSKQFADTQNEVGK